MKQKLFGFDVFVPLKRGIPRRMWEEVSERDVHTCQVCFTPKKKLKSLKRRSMFAALFDDDQDALQVHHIVKWPIGLTEPGNLILVCRHCHRDIHQIIDPYYDIEYLRKYTVNYRELGWKAIEECRRRKKKLRDQGITIYRL